jgi:hypothetical protein
MVKVGELKRKREWERISFRDWVMRGYARSGRYSVRVIFPPARYPSFTIVFEDAPNDFEVRLSLKAEKFKEVIKALGVELKKTNLPPLVVEITEDENGLIYGLDIDKETPSQLAWQGTFWRRWESLNEPWDDSLKDSF